MAKTIDLDDEAKAQKPKVSMKGLLFGVVGAILAGGAGFLAIYSGAADPLLGGNKDGTGHAEASTAIVYVALDPIIASLGPNARAEHLRFVSQLEVAPEHQVEVEGMKPRILDVLNTYLRVVDEAEVEDPAAMMRMRSQMLRRIQVVTGEGRVRDLLITEFVLN